MSTALQNPPITVDQYENFEGYPGLKDELINGLIVISPQAKPLHQQVAGNLERLINRVLEGQVFVAKQNSYLRFPTLNSMPAPDVFVIPKEVWNRACDSDDYVSETPVLVVEVLSPANRRERIEQKIGIYLSVGVTQVWLIRPKKQTFEIVTSAGRTTYTIADQISLPEPLRGTITGAAVFAREQ